MISPFNITPLGWKPSGVTQAGFNPNLYGTVWSWHRLNTGISEVGYNTTYYDPNLDTFVTVSNIGVEQWDDQSGNGRHLTQGTEDNRPTKTAIGGLKFDGINDTMSAGTQTSPTEYTQFLLYKPNQLGNPVLLDGSGAEETISLLIGNNFAKTADPIVLFGNNTTYTRGGTSWDILEYGAYQLITVKVTSAGNAFEIWVNGIKESVTYSHQNANCGGFSGTFIIGNSADCEILESLVYSTALSEADINTVNNYLLGLISYTEVGDIINTGFTAPADLTGWSLTNVSAFTTSPGGLVVNTPNVEYCTFTDETVGVEHWDLSGIVDIGDVSTTNFAIGIGLSPVVAGYAQHRIVFFMKSGFPGLDGKIEFYNGLSFAYSSAMPLSNNDIIYYECIRRGNIYRARFWKGATNWNLRSAGVELSAYRGLSTTFSGNITLCRPYIMTFGAPTNYTIKQYTFKSREKQNVEYMFIGDSITTGQAGVYRGLRYSQKAIDDPRKICVRAGGQERPTVQFQYMIDEVVRIAPQKVFILAGVNDVYYGVATATIVQAVRNLVDAIESALPSCQVYVCQCSAYDDLNAANLPTYNAALVTEFGAQCAVDMYSVTENPGSQPPYTDPALFGDSVHPNAAGHLAMAIELINSGTL